MFYLNPFCELKELGLEPDLLTGKFSSNKLLYHHSWRRCIWALIYRFSFVSLDKAECWERGCGVFFAFMLDTCSLRVFVRLFWCLSWQSYCVAYISKAFLLVYVEVEVELFSVKFKPIHSFWWFFFDRWFLFTWQKWSCCRWLNLRLSFKRIFLLTLRLLF